MDLGLGQWEMVAVISALTQLLKMFVLDLLPLKWGQKDKMTVALVFVATAAVLWMNFPELPVRDYLRATLFYAFAAMGGHGALKGSSWKLKKAKRF